MRGKHESVEWRIADLARRQHGVVGRRQLTTIGLGPKAIEHRVATGRLHALYRGAYAVGHAAVTPKGRFMAGVLACGPGAALGYRSAGQLWGLRTAGHRIEVVVPMSGRLGPRGLVVHRTRRVPPATRVEGIPVTTLGRTLVDLADVVSSRRLERALEDAERLRILNVSDIHPIPGRRGEANVRALLAQNRAPAETKSELERRFARFLRDHGLPWPVFNTLVAGIEVDVLWREQRVVVELDSWEYHGRARKPFEDDRDKDIRLLLAGYRTIRVTSRKLDRPAELAAQLRELLSRPV
jgi:very-short-patch-repair endonuclease